MTRKYTITQKRKARDMSQTDWEYRLEVARLINQGWSQEKVAKYFTDKGHKLTRAAVQDIYRKIKNMPVWELESRAKA